MPLLLARRLHWTDAHAGLLLFAGYAALSFLWTPSSIHGLAATCVAILALLSFQVGVETKDLRPMFVGASLGLVFSLINIFHFHLGFVSDPTPPSGLFENKNRLGEVAALVTIGAIVYRLWWFVPVPLAIVFLSNNRGALIGLAAAFAVALWGHTRYAVAAVLLFVFTVALALLLVTSHGGVDGFTTELQRAAIWSDTVLGFDWFGHGIGSYRPLVTSVGPFVTWHPLHAHNDWLQLLFVYGLGSVFLIPFALALHYRQEAVLVLVGAGGLALVQSPLSNPAALFIIAASLGSLSKPEVSMNMLSGLTKKSPPATDSSSKHPGGSVNSDTTRGSTAPTPKTIGGRCA